MGTDEPSDAAAQELEARIAEVDLALSLLSDLSEHPSSERREDVRERVRDLKATWSAENRRLQTASSLSEDEQLFYQPALRQAAAELDIHLGSRPGPRWIHRLQDTRFTLQYALDGLDD